MKQNLFKLTFSLATNDMLFATISIVWLQTADYMVPSYT